MGRTRFSAESTTTYREFAPRPELGRFARAFFSFMPALPWTGHRTVTREVRITRDERFDLPMLASAEASLVLDLGATAMRRAGLSASHWALTQLAPFDLQGSRPSASARK